MLEKTFTALVLRAKYKDVTSGFGVLHAEINDTPTQLTGIFAEIANGTKLDGLEYEVTGTWKSYKGQRQFAVSSAKLVTNDMLYFLSRFVRGLGMSLAQVTLNKYSSEELPNIIEKSPRKLLNVKGIGEKKLEKIVESWKQFKHLRKLSDFFAEKDIQISTHLLLVIERHFGENAKDIIEESPYRLAEIHRVGFKTADKLAMKLGVPKDSAERMTAAIAYVLKTAAEDKGHTLLSSKEVMLEIKELFDFEINLDRFKLTLLGLIQNGEVYYDESEDFVGLQSTRSAEEVIAKFFMTSRTKPPIAESLITKFIAREETATGVIFSDEQKQFIIETGGSNLTLALAGYAGVGKTTVFKTAFKMLGEYYCAPDEIVGCAFTGMAAARLREVSGVNSMTIHSLLKYDGQGFRFNKQNPLPYRVIALDEAAMVNVWLIKSLVEAVRRDTVFICIGDPAQLEPIGAGNVFADVIKNKLTNTHELTKIYRNSPDSVLTYFASFIRKGELPDEAFKSGWSDFEFSEIEPHNLFNIRKSGASELEVKDCREQNNLAILGHLLNRAAISKTKHDDPIWDFQVLSFMKGGVVGVHNLNIELQKVLNPSQFNQDEVVIGKKTLRLNDKIVHLQNRDMSVMRAEDWTRLNKQFMAASSYTESPRVFNGSLGKVVKIDTRNEIFYVHHIDDRIVEYDFDDYGKLLDLAYALTVHKSQGSQYKEVVIPMTSSQWMMLSTKSLYTAMTRATENVHFIGQKYAFKHAATNITDTLRKTNMSLMHNLADIEKKPLTAGVAERNILKVVSDAQPAPATISSTNSKKVRKALKL